MRPRFNVTDTHGNDMGTYAAATPEAAIERAVTHMNRPSRHFPLGVMPAWSPDEMRAVPVAPAAVRTFQVRSIDAVRERYCGGDSGWEWNDVWSVGGIDVPAPLTARRILKAMRDGGHLAEASAGACAVERDWHSDGETYTILQRSNGRPLFELRPLEDSDE